MCIRDRLYHRTFNWSDGDANIFRKLWEGIGAASQEHTGIYSVNKTEKVLAGSKKLVSSIISNGEVVTVNQTYDSALELVITAPLYDADGMINISDASYYDHPSGAEAMVVPGVAGIKPENAHGILECSNINIPVSYTHLTLPTILLV